METAVAEYPQADTKAELILGFIREHPGTSRNAIITGLKMNPSVVRRYVQVLIDRKLIEDDPTPEGWHRYKGVSA